MYTKVTLFSHKQDILLTCGFGISPSESGQLLPRIDLSVQGANLWYLTLFTSGV